MSTDLGPALFQRRLAECSGENFYPGLALLFSLRPEMKMDQVSKRAAVLR